MPKQQRLISETEKFKVKEPAGQVSAESPLPGLQTIAFLYDT